LQHNAVSGDDLHFRRFAAAEARDERTQEVWQHVHLEQPHEPVRDEVERIDEIAEGDPDEHAEPDGDQDAAQ
jgi:hypothetical protein